MKIHKGEKWMNLTAFLLPVLLFCVLFLGVSLARYENTIPKEVDLEYGSYQEQVFIKAAPETGEETQEGKKRMDFILSNGNSEGDHCTYDQTASLCLFVTLGAESPENYQVTLIDGKVVYESQWFEVAEGSSLYRVYGPGWLLRFYNSAGEEASWNLSGKKYVNYQMYIQMEGNSGYLTRFELMASAKPGSRE